MKLERLIIHNIASIADAEIDFLTGPLAEGGVFLIAGKTGAGKTTILDAICLALYARTPRFESSRIDGRTSDDASGAKDVMKVNDARQVMRRNTGEAYCELVFEGNNGQHYRASWSVARAHKKPDRAIQPKKWTLRNLDSDRVFAKEKEIEEEIGQAVGLDYSQFCRTTMLAQGEFTRFLNSKDSEKSSILSKITGTGIYSRIGRSIFERTREKRMELEQTQEKMKGITLFTDEETAERESRVRELSDKEKDCRKNIDSINALLEKLKELLSVRAELDSVEKTFGGYEAAYCALIAEYALMRKRIASTEEKISALEKEKEAEEKSGRTEAYRNEQVIQERLRTVCANRATIAVEEEKIASGLRSIEEVYAPQRNKDEEALKEAMRRLVDEENEIEKERKEVEGLGIAEMRSDKEQLLKKKGAIDLALNSLIQYEENRERLKKEQSQLEQLKSDIASDTKELSSLEESLTQAGKERDEAKREYDRQFVDQEEVASRIRSVLKDGDICPVCRRRIEQALPTDEEIGRLMAGFRQRYEKAQALFETIENSCRTLKARIKARTETAEQKKNALESDRTLASALERAKEALANTGLDICADAAHSRIETLTGTLAAMLESNGETAATLAGRLQKAEEREKLLKAREKGIKKLQKDAEEKKTALDATDQNIKKCNDAVALGRSVIGQCVDSIRSVLESVSENTSAGEWRHSLENETEAFAEELAEKARIYKETEESLSSEREQLSAFKTELKEAGAILKDIEELHPEWSVAAEASGDAADSAHYVGRESLSSRVSGLRSEIRTAEARRAELRVRESALVAGLEENGIKGVGRETSGEIPDSGNGYVEDLIRGKEQERQATLTHIAELNHSRGILEQELRQNDDRKTQIAGISKEEEERKREYEKWNTLNEAFGDSEGNRFQTIAQSYVLAGLIHSANHYMATLSPRYRLSVAPGTFIIMVEDSWQGGTRRAASTISGGESFLVSLALALALSDIGGEISVDTLFIDEGFGTLSDEELRSAVDTLRNLSSRCGRRVGIISHVADLRESIPVQVLVERKGGGRSEVTVKEL